MKAKILRDDLIGRFKAGEIGELLENDFSEKYDYKVLLQGTDHIDDLFGLGPVDAIRIYYFYKDEVELIEDENLLKIPDEFGVYCLYCGYIIWGKHSDELRKCPNCGITKRRLFSMMINVIKPKKNQK